MPRVRSEARLRESLDTVARLLAKHRVLETITQRQEGPRRELLEQLQHRQNVAELQRHLRGLHDADAAYLLEALPADDREIVWAQLPPERAGLVMVETSPAVRQSLVESTPRDRLVAMLDSLSPEDLAYISESLPADALAEVSLALEARERAVFDEANQFPEHCVGHHMLRAPTTVEDGSTVGALLTSLRGRPDMLPAETDRVFVIDSRHVLRGEVTLPMLLTADPSDPVVGVMQPDPLAFEPTDSAIDAAKAFERYDLVSAPVVDDRGKLIGRLTVDAIMDVLRDEAELRALKNAGLSGDEDLFGSPWTSARNRWPWLAINLVTAFVASRVIGRFEGVIVQLAALAALMPIVASIGGNTGNQTMALVIRGLALDQVHASATRRLIVKETIVGAMNGAVWGTTVGVAAMLLYGSVGLGIVMAGAVVLNLIVAAVAGVLIPIALQRSGRDPAQGASVLLTFTTDALGFFLFLGLATMFLV